MQKEEPVDTRPLVTMRCPKCRVENEARAGSTERCTGCGQMLAFLAAGKKQKAPKEPKESERRRRFREEAAKHGKSKPSKRTTDKKFKAL